jgi:DNA-binding beta-propeller fold protein YncE
LRRFGSRLIIWACAILAISCEEPSAVPPISLDGPTRIALARGEVCLDNLSAVSGVDDIRSRPCQEGEHGEFALIANEHTDRLAVVSLKGDFHILDLDPLTPGVNHLPVGRLPTDVAVSDRGTTAYSLNQLDLDISVVNLWDLSVMPERLTPTGMPIVLETSQKDPKLVAALANPSSLWIHPGVVCEDNAQNCSGFDEPATAISVDGTPSDLTLSPDGSIAYLVYHDRNMLSVFALSEDALGSDDRCLEQANPPCLIANIPLTFGCSDGVDNDDDGLIDQLDPECFGPLGAESNTGLGRVLHGGCDDEKDNGEEGRDRDDPYCFSPSIAEEVKGVMPGYSLPLQTPCSDGIDNDNDGLVDAPNDPDCYGPYGSSEETLFQSGFAMVSTDEIGQFVYVLDRAHDEVLIIDARRKTLLDSAKAALPTSETLFSGLGVPVSGQPTAIQGNLTRRIVIRDSGPSDHHVVEYDYGVYVAGNHGAIEYIQTLRASCRVEGPVADNEDFYALDTTALRSTDSAESFCLDIPAFPLSERTIASESVELLLNPRFRTRDTDPSQGRITDVGCEIPESMRLQEESAEEAGLIEIDCSSASWPQVRGLGEGETDLEIEHRARFGSRSDEPVLVSRSSLSFEPEDPTTVRTLETPDDYQLVSESWSFLYEGAYPATKRDDGLLGLEVSTEGENDTVTLAVQSLDLCVAGVQEGDRILIQSQPTESSACEAFAGKDENARTFEIAAVFPGLDNPTVKLSLIDGDGMSESLPTRTCFPEGISYEIYPHQSWIAVGSKTGFVTYQKTLGNFDSNAPELDLIDSNFEPYNSNFCVDVAQSTNASDVNRGPYTRSIKARFTSEYQGPTLGLTIEAGTITPARGLELKLKVERGFLGDFISTSGVLPNQVVVGRHYRNGTYLLVPDPSDDLLFIKNLSDGSSSGFWVR